MNSYIIQLSICTCKHNDEQEPYKKRVILHKKYEEGKNNVKIAGNNLETYGHTKGINQDYKTAKTNLTKTQRSATAT